MNWIQILLISFGVIWVPSILYVTYALRRDWAEIEEEAVKNDDMFSAFGCIPTPFAWVFFITCWIAGPAIVVDDFRLWFKMWRSMRKIRKQCRNLYKIAEKLGPEGEPLRESIRNMEAALKDEGKI